MGHQGHPAIRHPADRVTGVTYDSGRCFVLTYSPPLNEDASLVLINGDPDGGKAHQSGTCQPCRAGCKQIMLRQHRWRASSWASERFSRFGEPFIKPLRYKYMLRPGRRGCQEARPPARSGITSFVGHVSNRTKLHR